MSDLTNTPKREPAYGASADRYAKERALGAAVVEILAEYADRREANGLSREHPMDPKSHPVYSACVRKARALGLLAEQSEGGP